MTLKPAFVQKLKTRNHVLLDLMRNVLHNLNSSERLTLLDEFEHSRLHEENYEMEWLCFSVYLS